jgi:hypothetical protein
MSIFLSYCFVEFKSWGLSFKDYLLLLQIREEGITFFPNNTRHVRVEFCFHFSF